MKWHVCAAAQIDWEKKENISANSSFWSWSLDWFSIPALFKPLRIVSIRCFFPGMSSVFLARLWASAGGAPSPSSRNIYVIGSASSHQLNHGFSICRVIWRSQLLRPGTIQWDSDPCKTKEIQNFTVFNQSLQSSGVQFNPGARIRLQQNLMLWGGCSHLKARNRTFVLRRQSGLEFKTTSFHAKVSAEGKNLQIQLGLVP